MQDQLKINK